MFLDQLFEASQMNRGMKKRLESELGTPGIVEKLAAMAGSDFHSLMMEVYQQRAQATWPAELLEFYRQNRFVRPARVPMHVRLRLEQAALESVPEGFEVLELSPIAPLGNCSVLAGMSQDRIVSADRRLEVCADPTNLLALECASRRRKDKGTTCRLAASSRAVRAQPLMSEHHTAHFRLWTMCTAGRLQGNFEEDAIVEHLSFIAAFTKKLGQCGFAVGRPLIHFADWSGSLTERVLERMKDVECDILLEPERTRAKGYYRKTAFRVDCPLNGQMMEIGDGGFTEWTAKLCSDRREGLLISGLGMELLALSAQA